MSTLFSTICAHPLFGITLTLLAYVCANALWRRAGMPALLHPVLIATAAVAVMLVATGMEYGRYFAQTMVLNEALGLVIVLLAVPFYRQLPLMRQAMGAILLALGFGSSVALASALAYPALTGAEPSILATLVPKSVTAAVAVEISEHLGGITGLTAVIVITTGVFGAVFGPGILRAARVHDDRAVGFAIGVGSHAIGTARAFQISAVAGAFASLGMILNALLTLVVAPLVFELLIS